MTPAAGAFLASPAPPSYVGGPAQACPLLTAQQAAERTGITRKTIYQHLRSGALASQQTGLGRYAITEAALAAFLAAPERSVMTTGEVAALLRIHRKTVTAWAASGKLRSWRTPGGHYRYQRADATRLLPAAGRDGDPGAIRNGGAWHPNAPRRARGITRSLVWKLRDQGLSGRKIARQLGICEPVVRYHLRPGRPPARHAAP